ncbi:hypothetical protein CHAB381_1776 [Campylobacter hominis ATCC BAA-381]|uniref:Uncharacterized protein n=1 Tax=Campylobacter hominis (strain ATCC BAA-381 / DSM 21671 / CCUG 45161 / LMG 19568 / NCTC 13146 / CH001A) TaxID=360107 RepID=A7I445_CAMHC|nr:hypothetical protein CHAB381_1776 [Campylobacter hominis ATCC BAA-381]
MFCGNFAKAKSVFIYSSHHFGFLQALIKFSLQKMYFSVAEVLAM